MNRQMRWTRRAAFILMIIIGNLMVLSEKAEAIDWEATPSLNLRETYDDHVLNTNQRLRDWITIVTPQLSIALRKPNQETILQYQISLVKSFRSQELSNYLVHQLTLSHQRDWTARLRTSFRESLSSTADQSRLGAQGTMAQTGEILIPRTEVLQNRIDYAVAYDTSVDTHLEAALFRGDRWYKNLSGFNSTLNGTSFSERKQLGSDRFGSFFYAFNRVSVAHEEPAEIHTANLQYEDALYPTFSVSLNGGSSYTTEDHRFRGVYDVKATKSFDQGAVSASTQRTLGVAGGILVNSFENEAFSLQGMWKFTDSLEGSVQTAYTRNRSVVGLRERAASSTTTAGFRYQINAHWTSGVEYQYMRQRTEPATIANFSSNRISIVLIWEGTPWR